MSEPLSAESRRLPVIICGAGRVGLSLAAGLTAIHWPVARLLVRDESLGAPSRLVHRLGIVRVPLDRWLPPASPHLLLLSIPDDALPAVAGQLKHTFASVPGTGWIVLHTSGIHDATSLAPLQASGLATGSWHPAQTFAQPDGRLFTGIPVTIEGDHAAVTAGCSLALALGAHPLTLPPEQKQLYHCLCTISCSHLAALPLFCQDALAAFPPEDRPLLWAALLNLSRATLQNMTAAPDPRSAVTGPVVRGDDRTAARHMELLAHRFPNWRPVYETLHHFLQKILARP